MYGCDTNYLISLFNESHRWNDKAEKYYEKAIENSTFILIVSKVDIECVHRCRRNFERTISFIQSFINKYSGSEPERDILIEARKMSIGEDFLREFVRIYYKSDFSLCLNKSQIIEISRILKNIKMTVRNRLTDFIDNRESILKRFFDYNSTNSKIGCREKVEEIRRVLKECNICFQHHDDLVVSEHIYYSFVNEEVIDILTGDNFMFNVLNDKFNQERIEKQFKARIKPTLFYKNN